MTLNKVITRPQRLQQTWWIAVATCIYGRLYGFIILKTCFHTTVEVVAVVTQSAYVISTYDKYIDGLVQACSNSIAGVTAVLPV